MSVENEINTLIDARAGEDIQSLFDALSALDSRVQALEDGAVEPPPPLVGTLYYPPSPTGGDDTSSLNTFLASVPSGTAGNPSVVLFDPGHEYRLTSTTDTRLHLRGKSHVHVYGMAPAAATGSVDESTPRCTIRNQSSARFDLAGSAWAIGNSYGPCNNIKIIGFRIIGTNTANYRTLSQYTPGKETASGFQMYAAGGQHHVEIAYNIVEHQWGHGLYLRTSSGTQWDSVNVHHNVIRGVGVMGIAVANGTNIYIEDNRIIDTALFPIDFEDEASPSFLNGVYIRRNLIDSFGWNSHYPGPMAFTSYSLLDHADIHFVDNTIQGVYRSITDPNWDHTRGIIDIRPGGFSVNGGPGVGSNIVITGNVCTIPHDGLQVRVHSTTGLTVTGNTFKGSPTGTGGNPTNHTDYVLEAVNCSAVTQSGNTV